MTADTHIVQVTDQVINTYPALAWWLRQWRDHHVTLPRNRDGGSGFHIVAHCPECGGTLPS